MIHLYKKKSTVWFSFSLYSLYFYVIYLKKKKSYTKRYLPTFIVYWNLKIKTTLIKVKKIKTIKKKKKKKKKKKLDRAITSVSMTFLHVSMIFFKIFVLRFAFMGKL